MDILPNRMCGYWTTRLREALQERNFPTCRALLRGDPRPSLLEAFDKLVHRAHNQVYMFGSWPTSCSDPEKCYRENEERLTFLLEIDEKEIIKHASGAFLGLVEVTTLPPSSILLDAALPTEAAVLEEVSRSGKVRSQFASEHIYTFCDLRAQRDSTQARRDWDFAFGLATAILIRNWNVAHFLFQRCANMCWAQEKGMEYFPPVLSALRLAPSPNVVGVGAYQALVMRWDSQNARVKTDVRTALLHEACEGPLNTALFLTDRGININTVDGKGNSVLHRLFAYAMNK